MSQVDQFESVFRSAIRDSFHYEKVAFSSARIITDLEPAAAEPFVNRLKEFLAPLGNFESWAVHHKGDYATTTDLLNLVAENPKELLVTYRNLHSQTWRYPHSLGEHLDVLTQKTPNPVLVVPHPDAEYASDHALSNMDRVMAVTDHLSEDQSLVNYAVSMTQSGGKLYLMHIEDQKNFDRIIDSISKIPTIDTEDARTAIAEQLLKGPRDFIASCRKHLASSGVKIELEGIVEFGHFLKEYQSRIDSLEIDLLVINTKEDDQLAMHGLAYPLAVELRQIPILMI